MYELFRQYILRKVPLPQSTWEAIQAVSEERLLKAGTHLLQEGEICQHLYFLNQGLLRYYSWIDGVDQTKFFTFDQQLFTSQSSFNHQIPARENIQALEEVTLLVIPRKEARRLFREQPAWAAFIRQVIVEVNIWTDQLLVESLHLTAEDRYRQLLQQKPEWVQRIPQKYLASYLGIAPESLSRIRRKIQRKKVKRA